MSGLTFPIGFYIFGSKLEPSYLDFCPSGQFSADAIDSGSDLILSNHRGCAPPARKLNENGTDAGIRAEDQKNCGNSVHSALE